MVRDELDNAFAIFVQHLHFAIANLLNDATFKEFVPNTVNIESSGNGPTYERFIIIIIFFFFFFFFFFLLLLLLFCFLLTVFLGPRRWNPWRAFLNSFLNTS